MSPGLDGEKAQSHGHRFTHRQGSDPTGGQRRWGVHTSTPSHPHAVTQTPHTGTQRNTGTALPRTRTSFDHRLTMSPWLIAPAPEETTATPKGRSGRPKGNSTTQGWRVAHLLFLALQEVEVVVPQRRTKHQHDKDETRVRQLPNKQASKQASKQANKKKQKKEKMAH